MRKMPPSGLLWDFTRLVAAPDDPGCCGAYFKSLTHSLGFVDENVLNQGNFLDAVGLLFQPDPFLSRDIVSEEQSEELPL